MAPTQSLPDGLAPHQVTPCQPSAPPSYSLPAWRHNKTISCRLGATLHCLSAWRPTQLRPTRLAPRHSLPAWCHTQSLLAGLLPPFTRCQLGANQSLPIRLASNHPYQHCATQALPVRLAPHPITSCRLDATLHSLPAGANQSFPTRLAPHYFLTNLAPPNNPLLAWDHNHNQSLPAGLVPPFTSCQLGANQPLPTWLAPSHSLPAWRCLITPCQLPRRSLIAQPCQVTPCQFGAT